MRNTLRGTDRSLTGCRGRRLGRRLVRRLVVRLRGPDDLSQALSAFRKALACRRRLARLAPRFFDSAIVDQEARERAEEHQRWAMFEPLFEKYYGPSSKTEQWARMQEKMPVLPDAHAQQAVVRELADWELWFSLGQLALERYHRRQPHALPSLGQLAQLLDIASQLGRLATGLETSQPNPPPHSGWETVEADLQRAYGSSSPRTQPHEGAAPFTAS